MKRCIALHVMRSDVLLHVLGGFADPSPPSARYWSIEEDEYLRRSYTFVDMHALLLRLTNRTPGTIRKRACELRLTRPKRKVAMATAEYPFALNSKARGPIVRDPAVVPAAH